MNERHALQKTKNSLTNNAVAIRKNHKSINLCKRFSYFKPLGLLQCIEEVPHTQDNLPAMSYGN